MIVLVGAEATLIRMLATLNPLLIAAALLAVSAATIAVGLATARVLEKQRIYEECLERHTPVDSEDSGSCGG